MSNLLALRQDQEATDDVAGTADDVAEFCQRMRAMLAEKETQQRRDHQRRMRTLRGMALAGLLLASVLAYLWCAWK
jgi:type VI protein secretion system component VasF